MIHDTVPAAAAPDIIMVLVVVLGLHFRTVAAIIGAFCLGLLSDFASGQFVGPNAAASIVVFGLVGIIATRVYADRAIALMLIVFFCSLAKSVTVVSMYLFYLDDYISELTRFPVLRTIGLEAVLSALVAPLVLKLLFLGKPFRHFLRSPGGSSYAWSG
jgi:rod shape-determining protein MreD